MFRGRIVLLWQFSGAGVRVSLWLLFRIGLWFGGVLVRRNGVIVICICGHISFLSICIFSNSIWHLPMLIEL